MAATKFPISCPRIGEAEERSRNSYSGSDPNSVSYDQKNKHRVISGGQRFLPIIPLLGDAAVPESIDPWPRHVLDPNIYRRAIEERFDAIVEFEGSGGLISSVVSWIVAHVGDDKVADFAVNAMEKALAEAGLN